MKQSSQRVYSIPRSVMLFCIPFLFSARDSYNFSQAQPVDKASIYEFPKEFIGQWFDEFNGWWQIMLLEKKEDQTVNIWECSDKTDELSCMFYDRSSKSNIFYFDYQWTTAGMLRLVKEGYFKVSANNYKGAKETRKE